MITETWLKSEIENSTICPSNFNIVRSDRKSKGGGIAIFVNKKYPFIPILSVSTPHFEILSIDLIITLNEKTRIILVYFPPKFSKNQAALYKLCNELYTLSGVDHNTIIVGDFNLSDVSWENNSSKNPTDKIFLDFLSSSSLKQLVKFPTRRENIIDLIIANEEKAIFNLKRSAPFSSCDHYSLHSKFQM